MKIKKTTAMILLLLFFILSSCTSSGGGSGDADNGDNDDTTPEISVKLDCDRAVSEVIPTAGGDVSATGADGTVYTLQIPANALLQDLEVTLTPVIAAEIPLAGGLVTAVHIEPADILLMQPAVLTIGTPFDIAVDSAVSFAYEGMGEEFFLYPAMSLQTPVVMNLLHFSGYGIGYGTQADIDAQMQDPPGSGINKFAQAADQAVGNVLNDPDANISEICPALVTPMEEWFIDIETAFNDAYLQSSFETFVTASNEFLAWINALRMVDCENTLEETVDYGWETLTSTAAHLQEEAVSRCKSDHDISQILLLIKLQRIVDLLGLNDLVLTTAETYSCLTFQVDVVSESSVLLELVMDDNPATYRNSMGADFAQDAVCPHRQRPGATGMQSFTSTGTVWKSAYRWKTSNWCWTATDHMWTGPYTATAMNTLFTLSHMWMM